MFRLAVIETGWVAETIWNSAGAELVPHVPVESTDIKEQFSMSEQPGWEYFAKNSGNV